MGGKSSTESSNDDGGVDLVWIGEIDPTSERIAPRTVAGGDLPEEFSVAADPDVAGPTGRTAARGTATMADDREGETVLPATESRPQAPQDRDLDSSEERLVRDAGYRSVLSIPLAHDGDAFRYGTLTAYAERPGAFGDRLRDAVGFLATVAAHAVGALERERALLSDGVVELEVAIRTDGEDRDPLAALVRRLGRPVAVHAVVPRSSGGSTVYCTPSGTDSAETLTTGAIETAVDAIPALESFRWVGDGDGSADRRLELEFAEGTAANAVATLGGVLRSVRPGEDRTRLLVALPQPLDVRQFVDALGRTGREATLLARRERDHATRSARPFEAELENRLSERQLRTLESAYYGGFFDWPRESTGEEIAEALGVSQPTFSRHLRVAQGKLFELLFEERSVGEE
nr:bacterio-opsin activator domain-containing protein [Halobiforma nitratireducens]